jgi:protein-L-isoaspartate(D-aspartate) O-methyltransferase
LRAAGVRDRRVLAAFRAVSRAEFVPLDQRDRAELDVPIPIPHGQVTTQPSLVAQMVAALELTGDETVLEVGTGYGYQTALVAQLARFVWSVERRPRLAEAARAALDRTGVRNAAVVVGDGTLGLPDHAPFDAIVVSAAFPSVPAPLVEQTVPGGKLVQPIGPGGRDEVTLFTRGASGLERSALLTLARFVRLHGAHGFDADATCGRPARRC